jgi:hypothetical protein
MAATQGDIDRVRLSIAVPSGQEAVFTDALLQGFIEEHPVRDSAGLEPAASAWEPTYDLNAATSDLWGLIAVNLSTLYDFSADGASFTRSQAFENARRMGRYFNSRRRATSVAITPDRQREILHEARWPFAGGPAGAEWLDSDLQTFLEQNEAANA